MNKEYLNLIFSGFLFITFTFAIIESITFSKLAQFFPLYISIAGSALTFIYLISQIYIVYKQKVENVKQFNISLLKPLRYIGWVIGYLILIYIGGLMLATAIFLALFLTIESRMSYLQTSISILIVLFGVTLLSYALDIYWPTNLLGF
ncbi:hypothetical protein [Oceanobacillus kimchii]|uniref:hypothetical protein n=1 Tax=Oceanobacillus kimchii TaxID=746691 RepID=UPI003C70B2FE